MMLSGQNRRVRTTVNLPQSALELAKRKAAEGDCSLGEVIAEAIYTAYLARPESTAVAIDSRVIELPVSAARGGLHSGVRLESNAELVDVMDGRR